MILSTRGSYSQETRDNLELVNWTDGDGTGSEGYAVEYYFDGDTYLGPDEHGIEPVFAPYPV
jgi:hypothetical protein